MNEKVSTPELAELLAEQARIPQKSAAAFIRIAFPLISEILLKEKYLKISGLGTFKLITVSSRESVNVSTGKRILIDSYNVILTDGTSVEFNREGEWKEVKSFQQNIPDTLIPAEVKQYVSQNYPSQKIMAVERGKRKVSVDLANGLELEFDLNGNLIDIDN